MKDNPSTNLKSFDLLKPVFEQSITVFEALKMRKTTRSFSHKKIPAQLLSDILWAAQGVNRSNGPFEGPGRTAGSASNSHEILIYVTQEEGTYLYQPDPHKLTPIATGDNRPLAISPGQRKSGSVAPIRLIYVVDLDKFKTAGFPEPGLYDSEIQKSYYFVDTGLIAQNVYLTASALGLASWFHNCNKTELTKVLKLTSQQRPLFGHTVGYPED
jgi:nitroreductase